MTRTRPQPLSQGYIHTSKQGVRRLLIPYRAGRRVEMHVVDLVRISSDNDLWLPEEETPYKVLYGREVQRIKLLADICLPSGSRVTSDGHIMDAIVIDDQGLQKVAQWHAQFPSKLKDSQ